MYELPVVFFSTVLLPLQFTMCVARHLVGSIHALLTVNKHLHFMNSFAWSRFQKVIFFVENEQRDLVLVALIEWPPLTAYARLASVVIVKAVQNLSSIG